MKPQNIIEKIWNQHLVTERPGHPAVISVELMLIHEVTSAQAFDTLRARKLPIRFPNRLFATLDHSIPTRSDRLQIYDDSARAQVEMLRQNAADYGIPLYDFGSGKQGIVHVIGPELGLTQPGMTIVCGDSHTSTHGAFGALAFGIGTSEVSHVLATGCLLQRKPKTMRVEFAGSFRPGVYAKDAILKLISVIGVGGASGHVIEYCGDAVRSMSMAERMTICNMSIECGARAGLIAPDTTTFNYLKGREYAPRNWLKAVSDWQALQTDPGALFDRTVTIDVGSLQPVVTWGTNPAQAVEIGDRVPTITELPLDSRDAAEKALAYTKVEAGRSLIGVPIDWAFIGSCTNGRLEDLRIAAHILRGRRIHPRVTMYVVPGSEKVHAEAESEGLADIFRSAGADFRMPGCSMCLGMNDDKVPAGKRCVSSSNRNFVGRQGPGSLTHLASPATVAASAIEGCITSPLIFME